MARKLKPCPFCGSEVQINFNIDFEPDGIRCDECHMIVRYPRIKPKAREPFGACMDAMAERWNRREAQPTIIRCRDCKYSIDEYNDGDCYCKRPSRELVWIGKSWDFFCKAGEKREGESE